MRSENISEFPWLGRSGVDLFFLESECLTTNYALRVIGVEI